LRENLTKLSYALPRAARLRGDRVFRYLWKWGRLYREGPLALRAVFFPIALSEPPIKAAFLVRRKVLRRATERNRVRRLLREAHRYCRPVWEAQAGQTEAWLLWSWEASQVPALKDLPPLMQRLYDRAYQAWESSLFF